MEKFGFLLFVLQMSSHLRGEEDVPLPPSTNQEEHLANIVGAIRQGQIKLAEEQITQLGDAAPIAQIVHDVYARTESNIELIVNLTTSLPDVPLSNQILTVLREELKRNNHNDIRNLIVIAKAFKTEVVTDQNFTYTKPNPSLSEIMHDINDVASAFLVGVMQSNESYVDNSDVKLLAAALAELPTASSMAMQSLVADCFLEVDKDKLLDGIYSHSNTWQVLQGLYQFFWWMDKAGPLNSNIVLKHASLLSQTMKREDYIDIDPTVKYSIGRIVGRIPACARNLFFESPFCVWNRYQDSYMISSDLSHDIERRHIFTSPRTEMDTLPSGSSWRVKWTRDKLYFDNVAFPNENLYAADFKSDQNTRHLISRIPGSNSDDRSAWNVELDGDDCFLRNLHFDEYLVSSDTRYDSTDNRYVLAMRRDDPTANSAAFVWQIRSCEAG